MKIRITLFCIFCICMSTYSQELYWNKDNLKISNIHYNGYTLTNSSDNTIKVKIYRNNFLEAEKILLPKVETQIDHEWEFNRFEFVNYYIRIYYDLECYNSDLLYINSIANQRISNAKMKENITTIFRLGAIVAENFGNESWQKAGKITNYILDFSDALDNYNQNGLSSEFRMYLEEKLVKSKIANDIKNRYINSIVRSVDVLYDYSVKNINVDLKDLENRVVMLSGCISDDYIISYNVDYDYSIRPFIDYDDDGVLNKYDECPNDFGDPKYNGCTQEYYKIKKRKQIYNAVPIYWLDIGYGWSEIRKIKDDSDFETDLKYSAFYSNLTFPFFKHKYSNHIFGTFGININYNYGTYKTDKIKITTTDNSGNVVKESVDSVKIKEHSFAVGVSYNLIFKTGQTSHILLQPTCEIKAYSNQQKNIFEQQKLYAGLKIYYQIRFVGGIFVGVKYQSNSISEIDFHSNKLFSPQKSYYYYVGFSCVF